MLYARYKIILLLFIIGIAHVSNAQQQGYRRHFLSYGPSVSALAMGDAGVMTSTDPSAVYYNPSLLPLALGVQTSLSHWFLYDKAQYRYIGASYGNMKQGFGIGAIQFLRDNIEARKYIYDEPVITKNDQIALYGSYAKYLPLADLYVGVSAKYLQYTMYHYMDTGYSSDIGLYKPLYTENTLDKNVRIALGARIQNILQKPIKLISEEEKLPFGIIAGISCFLDIFPKYIQKYDAFTKDTLTLTAQVKHIDSISEYAGGVSYAYRDSIHLRGGYSNGIVSGVGISIGPIQVDYALMLKELGTFNRIGMTYVFGKTETRKKYAIDKSTFNTKHKTPIAVEKTRKKHKSFTQLYRNAKKAYKNKHYITATQLFKEISNLYPERKNVQRYYLNIVKRMNEDAETYTFNVLHHCYKQGYVLYHAGKIREAAQEWKKIMLINSEYRDVPFYYETIKKCLDDIETKEEAKFKEIEVEKLLNEAITYYMDNNFITAIHLLEQVKEECKNNQFKRATEFGAEADIYIEKSLAGLFKTKKNKKTHTRTTNNNNNNNIVITDKNEARKLYKEGLIAYAHGKIQDAIRSWEIAIQFAPNDTKIMKSLKKAKEETGVK